MSSSSDLTLWLLLLEDDSAAALATVVLLATYFRGPIVLSPGVIDSSQTGAVVNAGQPVSAAVGGVAGKIDPSRTTVGNA